MNKRRRTPSAARRSSAARGYALLVPALLIAACGPGGSGTGDARVEGGAGDARTDARADTAMTDTSMPDNRVDPPDMGVPDEAPGPEAEVPDTAPGPEAEVPDADGPDSPPGPDADMPDADGPDSPPGPDADMPDMFVPPVDEGPLPDTGCPAMQVMCGGSCVDTDTSSTHCGRCDNACPSGQMCVAGACRIACAAPRTVCGSGTMQTCVDTLTDNMNCGACGTACAGGTTCVSGACACATGQTDCSGTCRNLMTDAMNCGACGNACGMGQMCMGGMCRMACTAPQTLCVSGDMQACVNTQTDVANCGMCNRACAAEQVCTAGACACTMGRTACAASGGRPAGCFDTQTDEQHCGNCSTVCPAGQNCITGTCRAAPPVNDRRTGAIDIPLAQPTVTLSVNMGGSAGDTTPATTCIASCSATGADVFYRFVLSREELVYVDSFGSSFDTVLFFQDSAGNNITAPAGMAGFATCNDDQGDACGMGTGFTRTDSRIVSRLAAGTYYLVVKACRTVGATGRAQLNFQHLPIGNGAATNINPSATMGTATGNTSGTGRITGTCRSASESAPENTLWWATCPNFTASRFHATSCNTGTTFDTVLYQRSANRAAEVCIDDSNFDCGTRSSVTSDIPAGAGLHTLTVDGWISSAGAYNVSYRLTQCAAGYTFCGAPQNACLQTSRFQTDNNNCGGCGTVCSAGNTCQAGSCRPANNECATATPVPLGAPGTVTTVTGNLGNATDSMGSPRTDRNDVWFSFTTTGNRELIYIDTFGTSAVDTIVAVGNACGSAAVGSDDDSSCGAACPTGTIGCARNNSQLAVVLDPGTHYIVVDSYANQTGASVPFTLNIQRIVGTTAAVGGVYGDSVTSTANIINAGNFSLMGNTLTSPLGTRVHACGGTAAGRESTYYWFTCPDFRSATFSARTCTAASYDTVLEYRSSRTASSMMNQTIACEDDSRTVCTVGNRSAISASAPSGAGAHVLVLTGYNGATGTATITGTRP